MTYIPTTKEELAARETWNSFGHRTLKEKKNCFTCKFEPYWSGEVYGWDRKCRNPKIGLFDICKDSDPTELYFWKTFYRAGGGRDCNGDLELQLTCGRFELKDCEGWEEKSYVETKDSCSIIQSYRFVEIE